MTSLPVANILSGPMNTQTSKMVPLNFKTTTKLPESHVWTPDHPQADPIAHQEIPIVDLNDPSATTILQRACEEWGVFHVTNHGIPMSLLDEMEHQARRLFSLPAEDKMRALRLPGQLSGYGMARIAEYFPKHMWSEGFTIIGPPSEQVRKIWPQDHTEFCEVVEKYQEEMKQLAKKLMALMVSSLGLTNEDVEWLQPTFANNESPQPLHLNSYPICPDPTSAIGIAPHTDTAVFTILHQGNVSGLQVLREKIGWVTVPPMHGALTVNLGDLLHIFTNGRYKTPLHRVAVNNTRHRISCAYFHGPASGVKISPSMKLVKDGRPIYRAVTWEEFLHIKATHFNEAMPFIRI